MDHNVRRPVAATMAGAECFIRMTHAAARASSGGTLAREANEILT